MDNNRLAQRLLAIRQSLGLTLEDTAKQIGVHADTVKRFEQNSATVRHFDTLRKIISFIDEHSDDVPEIWQDISAQKNTDTEQLQSKIFSRFFHGKKYMIIDSGNAVKPKEDLLNPPTGKGCTFIYLRKEGKHHVFREERGGWIRTYTDNQLIGKYIKEVCL